MRLLSLAYSMHLSLPRILILACYNFTQRSAKRWEMKVNIGEIFGLFTTPLVSALGAIVVIIFAAQRLEI